MKRYSSVLVFFVLVLLFSLAGCKSLFTPEGRHYRDAKSAVARSDYSRGIAALSLALQLDPEYKKAILLLEEAYPQGVNWYKNELTKVSGGFDLSSLDRTAAAYAALVSIAESVNTLPVLVHPKTKQTLSFSPGDYREELRQAELNAAEGHYQEGIRLALMDDRESAKQSSREFLKALDYVPGYKDAREREGVIRQRAIQSVVFLPFSLNTGANYGADISRIIPDTIIAEIINNPEVMEYTQIVDQELVDQVIQNQRLSMSGLYDESSGVEIGRLVNANLILAGKVNNMTWDKPYQTFKVVEREAQVTPTAADLGREPLEGELFTVNATVYLFEAGSSAKIMASYKLIDIETGTIILSNALAEEVVDEQFWAEFEGDERALTAEDRKLTQVRKKSPRTIPSLLGEASEEIGKVIASRLKSYLK